MRDAWMVITTISATIHWLPVIGVTLLSVIVAAIWNLSVLFGRFRSRESSASCDGPKGNKLLIYGVSLILLLIAFTNLSLVVAGTGAVSGLLTSLQIGVVWVATSIAAAYLSARRSWRLIAVDTSLYIILFAFAGAVLGKL